jgi:TPR repeat protein
LRLVERFLTKEEAWEASKEILNTIKPEADLGKFVMRATRSLPSNLRLLGQCLLLGFLLTPVMAVGQSFEDTLRLAEEGNADAQGNLGYMHVTGEGVPQDHAEAVKWYRLAADQGLAEAQYNLGVSYYDGPQNYAEAEKWFRLAAGQGFANANFNLGVMYAIGQGVSVNYATAYAWFNIAAAFGHEDEISNRSASEARMTLSQIAEAQQLSTEFFERIQGNR